ncbi:MAG TPA: glycosyltransferase [Pedobacter sp.]|jgi:glycosyltransferase involved in cell wall biosynthesis
MQGISVIICCYNSEKRILKTLSSLLAQSIEAGFGYEVIVVNNNSRDNTRTVVEQFIQTSGASSYKIIDQPIPGLNAAREKGIETASYDLLIFCDDDNWLDTGYLSKAYHIMYSNPGIALLGGCGIPVTETSPPDWFQDFKGDYATGPQGCESGDITNEKGYVYGAGAILRKSAYLNMRERGFSTYLTDRVGTKLTSGGDVELGFNLRLAGFKVHYNSELIFHHFISKERLNWPYLKKLHFSFGYSSSLYVIQSNLYTQPEKAEYKFSWPWLFLNGCLDLLKTVLGGVMQFSGNNKKYQSELLRKTGYCYGLFKERKKLKLILKEIKALKLSAK